MKSELINFVVTPEEKNLLKKAAKNLTAETGAKENMSEAIRHSVKKYAETDLTKPEMFLCNREAIRDIDANVEHGRVYLEEFQREFHKVTMHYASHEELNEMFAAIGKMGSTAIITETIRQTVRTNLYETMVRDYPKRPVTPDDIPLKDMTELFRIADIINSIPAVNDRANLYYHLYEIDENGKVTVKEDLVEKMKDYFRFYASTPEQIKKLQKVKKLCKVLNEIIEDPEVIPEKAFTLVFFDHEAKQFSPSGAYVKFLVTNEIHYPRIQQFR